MAGESDNVEQQEAQFNMAVATLERIHTTLEKIRWGFESLQGIYKQQFHINQIKILFMNVSPLLKDETVTTYQKEVGRLKMKTKIYKGRAVTYYDIKLEERLFQIITEWSHELKKYFMPKRSDFKGL